MAYNNGFPMGYQPQQIMYQQGYPQNYQQQQMQPQQMQPVPQMQQLQSQQVQPVQQPQQQQIQNGGFMMVPSEEIVRTYPVAPGNCVTFKIEGQPIVMEKSMGFSQLEAPRIDKYRLVREEEVQPKKELEPEPEKQEPSLADSIRELKEHMNHDIDRIWDEIDELKSQISKPTTAKKKDSGGN